MTYVTGQEIQANDVTTLVGNLSNIQAYASLVACANKLAAIYGVGFGTYGYGQAPFQLPVPSVGSLVQSRDWTNIYYAISSIASHTNTNLSSFNIVNIVNPPTNNYLATGSTIATSDVEFNPPGAVYNWLGAVELLATNRNQVDATYMKRDDLYSLTSSRLQSRPFNSWIEHNFTVTFPSEDTARYFFNSGSQIRLTAFVDDDDETTASQAWATYLATDLANLGYIAFGATTTTQESGDNTGVGSLIGYYDLTSSYQPVFSLTFDISYQIQVEAKTQAGPFVGGSNGAVLDFIFKFNADSNTVVVDIHSEIYNYRPLLANEYSPVVTAFPLDISTPAYVTTKNLDYAATPPGPTPPDPQPLPIVWTLSRDLYGRNWNYNVWADIQSFGYEPSSGLINYTVTLKSGALLLSANTTSPAFLVPSDIPSTAYITFIVETGAVVAGCGGQGGVGAPSGVCGCVSGGDGLNGGPAIALLAAKTRILNYGIIGGGGGGGGGGGAECEYIWHASAGGGGGGAGNEVNAGQNNTCGVTLGRYGQWGQPGTITMGGQGGTPGNIYTASGGRGGDLGQPGSVGQNGGEAFTFEYYSEIEGEWVLVSGIARTGATGGAGGAAGPALTGLPQLDQTASQLNDIRGAQIN